MNMKYFCGIMAALTLTLCAVGCCGDDDSQPEIYLNNDNGMYVGQSPAAAAGGYRSGYSREVLVTAGTGEQESESIDDAVTAYVTEEDYSNRGNVDQGRSEWFAAHTLFNMEPGDDTSFFKGTWYRFNGQDDTYTTTVAMFDPIVRTGLLSEQKMPDTLLTKQPAGDGKNISSGGNKDTASTAANKTTGTKTADTKKAE